jgi:hypothetical protein
MSIHNRNCAIYRRGDLQAWCDCGAEPPVMEEIRRKVWMKMGEGAERGRIHRILRQVLEAGVSADAAEIINDELDAYTEVDEHDD